ncbi:cytosine permease [Mycolicibacterium fluoranthenivorans]|uniref:Cytosine permease n=1 Tax=Mycolicibacterium fluoranthenivorans TaxID=258505 RepID=A0A7G8PHP4_9MYCO|nr:cytosine permease [Mycolicibacterium fluoranthenivorans]QNJ93860.1 cytosine permease [Mycolicibacterium fluoranthenivorans]
MNDEYESEPVPVTERRSLFSVASVWAGFPMIITAAVTGATLVHGLGFGAGMVAIGMGNLLLLVYVGTLSMLAARTGRNFSLQASDTFGRAGYVVCSALLSTLVLGWFAVQTGLVGESMAGVFDVNKTVIVLVGGVLFTALTLLGIRALSLIGQISVPLFLIMSILAAVQAAGGSDVDVLSFAGDPSVGLTLGVGVTLVFALFADSGTMTADFTRWAKSPRDAWIATAAAFPAGNGIAMVIGGFLAAAAGSAGDVFGILAEQGGLLAGIAVIFLFINLGSVCTHCLYNAAVGWSAILGSRMRILTVALGLIGIIAASAGIWDFFISWLTLLGIIVPPIGAIIIVDQLLARRAASEVIPAFRWQPFLAWAIGSGVALLVDKLAPQLSTVVAGLIVGGAAIALLNRLTTDGAPTDSVPLSQGSTL